MLRRNGRLRLEVRDWGRGFNVHAVQISADGEHVGLTSMRERMHLLRGQLEIRSQAGHGTTLRATLPREPRPRAPSESLGVTD